ncbi:GGDEF domain-containing protein [Pseudomonas subflava]|uniref:GGDEF domain-containing protein n=1 Tax=Pseudomonas subflava TaxID=2952933 RepID=UPI00207A7936|nr:sensor domain-containing diguanylate cyclase [Pseudomonas subflava]
MHSEPLGSTPWSSERYQQGMFHLLQVVQELSLARDLENVQDIIRRAARRLTGCDGATFVLREGDLCYYADEDAVSPLWKGKRFPMESCISGWVMLHGEQAVIPDIYADSRIPHDAYRPTFVQSLVMVPIRSREPIGAIGNYWAAPHQPCAEEVQLLQALADSTSIALENVRLSQHLDHRVQERTRELQQAYDRIHRLSMTDELTGLHNRRGFYLLADQALRHAARYGGGYTLMLMDLDGLKQVNDQAGHEAGDALLRCAAEVLRSVLREADVAARMGGDEFCVLAPGLAGDNLCRRLQQAIAACNEEGQLFPLAASIGLVEVEDCTGVTLDDVLARADERMYADKRSRRASATASPSA